MYYRIYYISDRSGSAVKYLYITAARNLSEPFLTLQRLIHLIVRHTEHSQLSLIVGTTLRKHHKVRHERHDDRFSIQLGSHGDCITWSLAVDEPEPVLTQHSTTVAIIIIIFIIHISILSQLRQPDITFGQFK